MEQNEVTLTRSSVFEQEKIPDIETYETKTVQDESERLEWN